MILFYFLLIPILYFFIRFILYFIVQKYGKISYDGFSAAGFAYHYEKEIFYSTKNAWQKNFGYTHTYDVFAPFFQMIIDTEPIKFYYNNKNWLITFWKGQYGIVTGAEIGVYCTDQKKVSKKTLYFPVNNNEMLNIYLILYKNNKVIARINAKHWWLAIFKLGMFSNPKDLSMDINITFPNQHMLNSFLTAFQKLGYSSKDFTIIDNTFCFKYIKPHPRKVCTRSWFTDSIRQFFNKKNVELYNKSLDGFIDDNKIDDSHNDHVIIINELLPDLIKNSNEKTSQFEKIKNNIFNKKEKNIIFLKKDFPFESSVKKNE